MELKESITKLTTGFVSKLKLPTFGKSPLTISTSKTIECLNIAGTSNMVQRAPLPGALRRRSKSSSDLTAIFRKPLSNRVPMPPILAKKVLIINKVQQQKESSLKNITNDEASASNKLKSSLRRRSKSVTDLTQMNTKPVAKNTVSNLKKSNDAKVPPICVKNIRRIPHKEVNMGIKRAISDNTTNEQPKPKVMRSARIPPYDYKARFQQLEGIHQKLKSDHEVLMNNFSTYKEEQSDFMNQHYEMKARMKALETDKLSAQIEVNSLKEANDKISLTNTKLLSEIGQLRGEVRQYQSEIKIRNAKIEAIQTHLHNVTANLEHLSKAMAELKDNNKTVSSENEQRKLKNEELIIEIVELKAELERRDLVRQKLHNDVQDLKGNIRVFCRVRPQIPNENKLKATVKCTDDTDIEIRRLTESVSAFTGKTAEVKQEFSFDRVFDENSTQADIFVELSQLVQSALDGYNVCVFAYGQTGSGKTYTMQGYDADHEGMIPRSLRVIFHYGDSKKNLGWTFAIQASFLEIYNESLNDLLNIKNKEHLEIFYNEGKGVSVRNLTIQAVDSYIELRKLMNIAHKNRTVAATDFNLHSSRSHAVTQIYITAMHPTIKSKLTSIINLVDLAGSESAKTSSQERLTETKSINKSLSTLGTVMSYLGAGKAHVPYRNSKLTFLLQSCLGGNSKTLMVVHVSPNEECYNESVSSLRFAAQVKSIKTASKRNKTSVTY